MVHRINEMAVNRNEKSNLTFRTFFAGRVAQDPDAPAVTVGGRSCSWRELDRKADAIAGFLSSKGIRVGSHVGLCAANSDDWIAAFFAINRLGAMAMLINAALSAEEIRKVRDCGNVRYLLSDVHEGEGADLGENVFDLRSAGEQALPYEPARRDECDDPSIVIFTSGSTGRPKGVLLSAYNIIRSAEAFADALQLTSDDRVCLPLPFFHIFGLSMLMATYLRHAELHLVSGRRVEGLLMALTVERGTVLALVPTLALALTAHPGYDVAAIGALRRVLLGGAACGEPLLHRLLAAFPESCDLQIVYGLSEMAPITISDPGRSAEALAASVGRPVDAVRIRVAENGEILARGDHLMAGYYRTALEDQSLDGEGWLHTGDLGELDDDGRLRFRGRNKDVIIRGGENIMPEEVVDALMACSGVADARVFGEPDEFWGETVLAVVAPTDGFVPDERRLAAELESRLAKFKRPSRFVFLKSFPQLANGKVDMVALKQLTGIPSTPERS